MTDLRLLVVASDPLARAGLATLLADRPGFQIVGQIEGGGSLQDEIDVYQPDLIVWDLGWDPQESLAWLEDLEPTMTPHLPAEEIGIVALVSDDETANSAWSAGARGLLFRNTTGDRLLAAISSVAGGLAAIEPELIDSIMPAGTLDEPVLIEDLTPRELEVLQLLAEGLANRAIAQQLGISEHTVKFHVNAIMKKTGAQSRTAAVMRATRLGLVVL
ncbi:MAG TPA: response regulator transcription factor [candidate division Zixibacteria bacterium]|nr:response regulator transcription factor [candidate division Zixibacteria bacterium]